MENNLINLNVHDIPFGTLASNAQSLHKGFVEQAAIYMDPKPDMSLFQQHITTLKKSIVAWGKKGNRGSSRKYRALLAAVEVVKSDMQQLACYVQYKTPNNADLWRKVGFAIKLPKSAPQPLEAVQNFRHFISRKVPAPGIKLRWKKPLNSGRRNVKAYVIHRSNTPVFPGNIGNTAPLGDIWAVVTDTIFIDMYPMHGANWYWVTPFGSAGLGVTSNPVKVMSFGREEEE